MTTIQPINRRRESTFNVGMVFWMLIFAALVWQIRNVVVNLETLSIRTHLNHEEHKVSLKSEATDIEKIRERFRNVESQVVDIKNTMTSHDLLLHKLMQKIESSVISKQVYEIITDSLDQQKRLTSDAITKIQEKAQEQVCQKFCISKFTN